MGLGPPEGTLTLHFIPIVISDDDEEGENEAVDPTTPKPPTKKRLKTEEEEDVEDKERKLKRGLLQCNLENRAEERQEICPKELEMAWNNYTADELQQVLDFIDEQKCFTRRS